MIPQLYITPGEPSGIGPDILIKAAQKKWPADLIAVCDPSLLQERAKLLGIKLPSSLKYIETKLRAPVEVGKLNVANSAYVLETLKQAANLCKQHKNSALITGPVHKSIINDAGFSFTGHTEFFANHFGIKTPIMLFIAKGLRVALATTHIPLSKVSETITQENLIEKIEILHDELQNKFKIPHPKILVCGVNPHAGEMGHLGNEEIETISPALNFLREKNINVIGPLPADTLFTEKYLKNCDAVFAMFHDQALPIVKYMSFGHAVNVTLGLPIIRTSVDHGTALDIAGSGKADSGSLEAAIELAIELVV